MDIADQKPFVIDLNDPQSLSARHAQAEAILSDKRRELDQMHELVREIKKWESVVAFLESQLPGQPSKPEVASSAAPAPTAPPVSTRPAEMQPGPGDLAVEVVNREVRKIRSSEVRDILASEGHDLSRQTISNALHYAAKSGKIKPALGRGMYAPLEYQETELPDPTATNGATGLQAQTSESYSAPAREDWLGGRHPATST
ncbi:MAG TPA: hypothetical protein VL988_11440 [Solirubrobacteraceae bacterium]|nr:hypothetical protein [Solirubrobacteraceae bacterium]